MNTEDFMGNFLQPASDCLDRRFTLPLPDIAGLEKTADFIVQSRCGSTFSTNSIARYESLQTGLRFVEVYKSSQNFESGRFVRLVGTMALVRKGCPFLFLDAAATNINLQTGQAADVCTRIAVHMPQAADEGRQALMDSLSKEATAAGLPWGTSKIDALPLFWGPLWHLRMEGIATEAIAQLRMAASHAYQNYCDMTTPAENFDYLPVQQQMILKNAQAEHGQFLRMGLAVPVEVQAAFFSVLCTGV